MIDPTRRCQYRDEKGHCALPLGHGSYHLTDAPALTLFQAQSFVEEARLARDDGRKLAVVGVDPIPMRLLCERCGELHVDEGEFATKPHHTHACQKCGAVWRPAIVATVGVRFLPGFKNETPPSDEPTTRSNIDADPRLERRCPTCKAPFWVLDRRWGIRAVRCECPPAPLP